MSLTRNPYSPPAGNNVPNDVAVGADSVWRIQRPIGVWLIVIGSALLLIVEFSFFGLRLLGSSDARVQAYLDGLPPTWWLVAVGLALLGVLATWTLFTMQITTMRWWLSSIIAAIVMSIFDFFLSRRMWIEVINGTSWLKQVMGDGLLVMIYAYVKQLNARGLLLYANRTTSSSHPLPSEDATQPLLVAGMSAGSVAMGGHLFVATCIMELVSTVGPREYEAAAWPIAFGILSLLLMVSGLGLWWRWPFSRQVHVVSAAGVGYFWGATNGAGLMALGLSWFLLTRASVNRFLASPSVDEEEGSIRTPLSLRVFYWAFFVLFFALLILRPYWEPMIAGA